MLVKIVLCWYVSDLSVSLQTRARAARVRLHFDCLLVIHIIFLGTVFFLFFTSSSWIEVSYLGRIGKEI